MTRHQSRTNAFKLIFSLYCNDSFAEDLLAEHAVELELETDELCGNIVHNTVEHLSDIDAAIEPNLKKWSMSRLPHISLAVLRISCAQLMYMQDIPASVVIDEAVELAKEFGQDDEYSFVNGVLRSVAEDLGRE